MDEARKVLERLHRIEVLEREGAAARSLLAEVHELLREAAAWLEVEGVAADPAGEALERCRDAIEAPALPR